MSKLAVDLGSPVNDKFPLKRTKYLAVHNLATETTTSSDLRAEQGPAPCAEFRLPDLLDRLTHEALAPAAHLPRKRQRARPGSRRRDAR